MLDLVVLLQTFLVLVCPKPGEATGLFRFYKLSQCLRMLTLFHRIKPMLVMVNALLVAVPQVAPLYLPYISRISPVYLPSLSPRTPAYLPHICQGYHGPPISPAYLPHICPGGHPHPDGLPSGARLRRHRGLALR